MARRVAKKKAAKKDKDRDFDGVMTSAEEARYEMLREWRKTYADKNDIPAFIVFSNKAMRSLAKKDPRDLDELKEVYGFGEHKVEHLGPEIIQCLNKLRS